MPYFFPTLQQLEVDLSHRRETVGKLSRNIATKWQKGASQDVCKTMKHISRIDNAQLSYWRRGDGAFELIPYQFLLSDSVC